MTTHDIQGPINDTPAGVPVPIAANFDPAELANIGRAPSTRLKMRVNAKSISNVGDNPLTHLSLAAVQSMDQASENYVFGKYTPCGNLSFSVIKDVADKYEIGDQVYVDLTLAR